MPKLLIASTTDLFPELGHTILWGDDVERVLASTATTALELARTFVPSMVVVDDADSAATQALIRHFRDQPGTRRSSIVVVSRSASAEDVALKLAGANLVVRGPLEPAVWNQQLADLLTIPRRLRVRFPIEVRPVGAPEDGFVAAESFDISIHGMLLVASVPIPADTLLELRFTPPESTQELRVIGSVVRSAGTAPVRIGIQFVHLEGDAEDQIAALLASIPPARSFGRYEPLGLLGEGAMGRVYRAFDPLARRVVAIKTPRTEHITGPDPAEFLRRFRREAQAAAQLVHPNIVTIHDVGDDYFVMEYLEGATLQSILRDQGALDPSEVCHILAPIGEALDYAHGMGIIHRDVKPANIMILAGERPKIMDFGVAYVISTAITAAEGCFGSPAYMAPEQVLEGKATAATDIYSLAAVAYEALSGHRPFEGEAVAPVLFHVVNTEPLPPSRRKPSLGASYDELFRRALAKDPTQRFDSAKALVEALRTAGTASGTAITAAPFAASPAVPSFQGRALAEETLDLGATVTRPARRRGRALVAATVALVAILIAARASQQPPPIPASSGFHITTEPAGATVWLDGKSAGKAPLLLADVSRGSHAVRAIAEGFAPAELSVEAQPGPPVALHFRLQSASGTLDVESEPQAAAIRVDGRAAGHTPVAGVRLAPGARLIEIDHDNYRTWARVVDVKPGETQHLVARLERAPDHRPRPGLRPSGWVRVGDLVALGPDVTPPQRLSGEPAPYPEAARRLRLQGTVTLEFTVTETGGVSDARVVESAGEILDQEALNTVRGWRYKPAEVNSVRVQVRIRTTQTF